MLHDNDDGSLPTDLKKRKIPEVDGLYAVKCKGDEVVGLITFHNKSWFSYPAHFSLHTTTINEKIEFCIGPIPNNYRKA